MKLKMTAALAAGLSLCAAGAALAQTAESQTTEAQAAAVPAAEPQPAAPAAEAQVAPTAGPMVTYVVRQEPPTLIVSRPANGALGMLGALAAISEGKRIAAAYALEEPANLIGAEVAQAYALAQSGQVTAEPIKLDAAHKDPVAVNAGKARYLVTVAPANLNVIYFVTKFGRYHLLFFTKATLVDTSTGKVLAKGQCKQVPEYDEATSPTYDQMMDNQGAGLKAMVAASSKTCAETLKTQLFAATPAVRAN
jgi:hypothetical protein